MNTCAASLVSAEGVFTEDGTFVALPPPEDEDEDVQGVLGKFLQRLTALLERFDLEALLLESGQTRL